MLVREENFKRVIIRKNCLEMLDEYVAPMVEAHKHQVLDKVDTCTNIKRIITDWIKGLPLREFCNPAYCPVDTIEDRYMVNIQVLPSGTFLISIVMKFDNELTPARLEIMY